MLFMWTPQRVRLAIFCVAAYLALPEIVGSLTDDAVGAVLEVGR